MKVLVHEKLHFKTISLENLSFVCQLDSLKDAGERHINEKHFDARNIKSVLDNVTKR